jgi:TAG lipase/steryl ester hydrolase/phospholipase A2/LPA acyltransferase
MSFLSDAIFSGGSTRLHAGDSGRNVIRKSKSHGGLLAPLAQLIRGPAEVLNSAVASHGSVPGEEITVAAADRKQILYMRMKDVGIDLGAYPFTC